MQVADLRRPFSLVHIYGALRKFPVKCGAMPGPSGVLIKGSLDPKTHPRTAVPSRGLGGHPIHVASEMYSENRFLIQIHPTREGQSKMSIITTDLLTRAGALPAAAALYAGPLAAACDKRGIISAPAVRCLLANILNETSALTQIVESTYYSSAQYLYSVFSSHFTSVADAAPYARNPTALAAKVYGNTQGRGCIQLTGIENYTAYAAAVGRPVSAMAAYLETPEGAADSAAWFYVHNGCLPLGDAGGLLSVTRKIEGGTNPIGWPSVQQWNVQLLRAMGGGSVGKAAAPSIVAHPIATQIHAGSGVAAGQPTADELMDKFNPQLET